MRDSDEVVGIGANTVQLTLEILSMYFDSTLFFVAIRDKMFMQVILIHHTCWKSVLALLIASIGIPNEDICWVDFDEFSCRACYCEGMIANLLTYMK